MTQDVEGVIKYQLDYVPSPLPADADPEGLFRWFRRCRELDLIGRDAARYGGYAYGNISIRTQRGFVITGSQTGGSAELQAAQLAWVIDFDVAGNRLRAGGPAAPSSEAMTHGQVYRALAHATAVIHVHSPALWCAAADLGLPVTPPSAEYGTAAMAAAVEALLLADLTRDSGVFAMGGHEDGIVAYGNDIDRVGELLLAQLERVGDAGR